MFYGNKSQALESQLPARQRVLSDRYTPTLWRKPESLNCLLGSGSFRTWMLPVRVFLFPSQLPARQRVLSDHYGVIKNPPNLVSTACSAAGPFGLYEVI